MKLCCPISGKSRFTFCQLYDDHSFDQVVFVSNIALCITALHTKLEMTFSLRAHHFRRSLRSRYARHTKWRLGKPTVSPTVSRASGHELHDVKHLFRAPLATLSPPACSWTALDAPSKITDLLLLLRISQLRRPCVLPNPLSRLYLSRSTRH